MPTERMRRVNEVMREVIGSAIATELEDPRIGFVTVTSVETSPDLRSARVHVSVLGGEAEREATLAGLSSSHGVLQASDRPRDANQAHSHAELPLRRDAGARRPRLQAARPVSEAVAATAERKDASLEEVAQELRAGDRFLLTTHEGPDGDALGSLLALHRILTQLGKDSVMFLAAKEFPLPVEYRFLPLEEVFHEPPVDVVDRVLVFLDCGNIDRMPVGFLHRDEAKILNIDHHHDNTRFGTLNLVDTEASCTAEILFGLAKLLGAELTPEIAGALYVALVTDTGRFMYENTEPGHAPHGRGADRGRAWTSTTPTGACTSECRSRSSAWWRAPSSGSSASTDCNLAVTYISADDYARHGRERHPHRGDHRPRARARGHRGRGDDPRQDRRRPRGAQGEPALDDGQGRCLRDRAQARRRRPPAGGRLLDRPRLPRAGRVPL